MQSVAYKNDHSAHLRFCLACEGEARNMYCLSGVVGGENFVKILRLGHFLKNYNG